MQCIASTAMHRQCTGVEQCNVRCGLCCVQCSAVQCSAVQCCAVQCSAVQCSAVQCSAVQCECSAVQCSAVQCSAVQCSREILILEEAIFSLWNQLFYCLFCRSVFKTVFVFKIGPILVVRVKI